MATELIENSHLGDYQDIDAYKVKVGTTVVDSDHPTFIFVKLMYWDYFVGEDEAPAKFNCSIVAASPGMVSEKKIQDCCNSMGIDNCDWDELEPVDQAWELAEYGCAANLWQENGDDENALWNKAGSEVLKINTLFGFYMDKAQNAIGSTGWDFIKGEL